MNLYKQKNYYKYVILTSFLHFIDCGSCLRKTTADLPIIDPTHIVEQLRVISDIVYAKNVNMEDVHLNVTQLVTKYCCAIQEHQIGTDDGYLLTLFRIEGDGPPVFLMHGFYNSADDWVTAGPESGLAYILAAAGFDVWIGNARGNKYSRHHIYLSPDEDTEFWDFSWDEIGNYDLPAMIDYILYVTNKTQLAYIGHSQGTTSFFVLCSEQPEYNNKISIMIALSPVAWFTHVTGAVTKLITPYILHYSWILKLFNYHELKPQTELFSKLCDIGNGIICIASSFTMIGFDFEQVNKTNTRSVMSHIAGGASLNQLLHYCQLIESKTFQKFDYGADMNEAFYGTSTPPKYPVEKITAPVALIYSENDWLANTADVLILKKRLKNVIMYHRVPFKKFNHLDFLYAKNVKRLVYDKVVKLIETASDNG